MLDNQSSFNELQLQQIEQLITDKFAELRQGSQNKLRASEQSESQNKTTMLVMSNDLDKLMGAFIVANAAAAMGGQVTMFFTFWGLTAIRKSKVFKGKSWMEKMVTLMLPGSAATVHPSKFCFGGFGRCFFRFLMKKKNVATLDELVEIAKDLGVEMIACEMSMDVMGVQKCELIDGCTVAGAAVYVDHASNSNVTLFI